jgi:hypothetical protein
MHRTLTKAALLTSAAALLAACAREPEPVFVPEPQPILSKDGRVISSATVTPGSLDTDGDGILDDDDDDDDNDGILDIDDDDDDGDGILDG